MDASQMRRRIEAVRDLPTLPTVALEVNRLLEDVNTRIQDITAAIENDQALTVKILRLVNSAFFGLRGRVGTIARAVVVLGFNTVRSAVLSVSVLEAFSGRGVWIEGFDIRRFWAHALAVAVTSRQMAEALRAVPPEDAFTAGLIHDVGKLVLCQYFPDIFARVWDTSVTQGLSFFAAESRHSPLAHPGIGCLLARSWQLPEPLVRAVGMHHARPQSTEIPLWLVVHAANAVVRAAEAGPGAMPLTETYAGAPPDLQAHLGTVDQWFPALSPQIDAATGFFLEDR